MRWIAATAALGVLLVSSPASAHTEPDLVAVPANSQSTITLKPTHGCGDSPTVQVRIRAPMEGAVAEPVEGWTASSTPDGAGNTVLEWSGGPLPTDTDGAFPVSFSAPDAPGLLLIFPAIQVCESGAELAWIDGDPQGEYPAPRVLVLPAGYEPAETIDDVPLDAPGRQQLVEIVDVDNPQSPTTSVPPAPTTTPLPVTTAPPAPTTVVTTAVAPTTETGSTTSTTSSTTAGSTTTVGPDDEGGGSTAIVAAGVVGVVAASGAGAVLVTRRRRLNGN